MVYDLADVATALRSATRQGASTDVPEGARFIVVSDTLANVMADTIERFLDDDQR